LERFLRSVRGVLASLEALGAVHCDHPKWDSPWAWSDPGHTRIISRESLIFLSQAQYEQVGSNPMSDYRPWYKADFDVVATDEDDPDTLKFILMAVK
jgi:hypothetical protein